MARTYLYRARAPWVIAVVLLGAPLAEHAGATESSGDKPEITWVSDRGRTLLRVPRSLVHAEMEKAATLWVPDDKRFAFRRSTVEFRPRAERITIRSAASAAAPFVHEKDVTVTVTLKPRISGRFVRLTYESSERSLSGCGLEGPVCFLLRRALDTHLGDGDRIQAFLDQGLNAQLRASLDAPWSVACPSSPARPRRVIVGPDRLDVEVVSPRAEAVCLKPRDDFLPTGLHGAQRAHSVRAPSLSSVRERSACDHLHGSCAR